jgi:hypothetical protein
MHHELLDYYSVCVGAVNLASSVDKKEEGYNGVIRYRATASGVADEPEHDGMVNQVHSFNDDQRTSSVPVVYRNACYRS